MKYSDFVLQFDLAVDGGYRVRVVASPAGEGMGEFQLPFKGSERFSLLNSLAPREAWIEGGHAPLLSPRAIGSQLFRALFSGQIGQLYEHSRGSLQGAADHGLRLKIKLNLHDPDVGKIHALPWEGLYQEERKEFLAFSRRTSIVRYLDVARPALLKPLPVPLRILVAIASPPELTRLDFEKERSRIEKALAAVQRVELVFLERVSLSSLRETLLEQTCHVLHFIGHGRFQTATSRGNLVFEEDGRALPVSGMMLANVLSDFDDLQVVVLNACNAARSGQLNPFAGVAAALLMGGVSSVVAMQAPIGDGAAIRFSDAFYHRLAAGDPLDAAVTEGRHAIHASAPESAEWVAPVLFQRIPDGQVWQPVVPEADGRKESARPVRTRGKWLWRVDRKTRAAILAVAALGTWFLLRLEVAKPGQVSVLLLTDERVTVQPDAEQQTEALDLIKGINDYPISLAALARLVDAVAANRPSIIGLDISLAQSGGDEARALARSLVEAETAFVLAQDDDEPILPVLGDTCRSLGSLCEVASIGVVHGPFTLAAQLSSGKRLFFLALTEKAPLSLAGEVILPISAASRLDEALVPVPMESLLKGVGTRAIQGRPVVIGGIFEGGDRAPEVIDRHRLFVPWGKPIAGAEIQALVAAYALKDGLLWVVDSRYPFVLLVVVSLASLRWPSLHGWFAALYLLGALVVRAAWPIVLPLWPVWLVIPLDFLRRRRT